MNRVQWSQAYLRKRKAMMILPLLVTPFLTMAFWAMGGGKNSGDLMEQPKHQGLNMQLPIPNLKLNKDANKMSFYDLAMKDSLKLAEQKRNDPYFPVQDGNRELEKITESAAEKYSRSLITQSNGLKVTPYDKSGTPAEDEVMKKLVELDNLINHSEQPAPGKDDSLKPSYSFGNDVDRLENMMKVMNDKKTDDPEMKRLESTLDKILDIQHPERIKSKTQEPAPADQARFQVSNVPGDQNISFLDTVRSTDLSQPGFWGLDDESTSRPQGNSFEAVIHENQVLVNGAVIKLRLVDEIFIGGALIPKGNFVYGTVTLNGERLEIQVNSIRSGNSLYPVKLEVYDIDGLPGIYIPGAITRDAAKQSADNNLQSMELSTLDHSLKAQATAAGIGAAKNLLSKKIKLTKVFVKAGYKILLK